MMSWSYRFSHVNSVSWVVPSCTSGRGPSCFSFCLVDGRWLRSSFLHLRRLLLGLSDNLVLLLRDEAARLVSGLQSELRLIGVGGAGRDLFLCFFFLAFGFLVRSRPEVHCWSCGSSRCFALRAPVLNRLMEGWSAPTVGPLFKKKIIIIKYPLLCILFIFHSRALGNCCK